MRKILHIDLNSFYASVECLLDESLFGKPVAVSGAVSDRHGVVLAKNQQAKVLGIKTGMTVYQAKKLVPDLIIRETHHDLYMKYSKVVKNIFYEYTDYVESFGIDEAWLDVTSSRKYGGDAYKLAEEIRNRVKDEVGLTVSIGVSFNKVFAKLGSDMKKPDAVTVISYENFREKIFPIPVENLLYVGRATKEKLNKLNIHTIGELAVADENLLNAHLGKWGSVIYAYANGHDYSEVKKYTEKDEYKSIGNSITFYRDLDNELDVETLIILLSESVCSRMKDYGYKHARSVTLTITTSLLNSIVRMKKIKHPTCISGEIADAAMSLFKANFDWGTNVRGLGVAVSDFKADDQLDFYVDLEKKSKKESLENTVENLRKRFGRTVINKAVVLRDEKFAGLDIKDSHSLGSLGKNKNTGEDN
ncbi:MAG: DNA polymerase IV [Clostridia bacterium]|nr:DNA polymerase IV [Clostridia bacterium]